MKIYRIEIWCSDDSCQEFWFDKHLSDFYLNIDDAQKELSKYANMTERQLERACDVINVSVNKPRIVEYNVIGGLRYD